ncbi:hypothetical protein, partial [Mycobacterium sp.]|uniref:hypothetical protein n=1 Tax=Mycobacterium sp. TaxID=1785 RepID=UPI003F9AA519
LRPDSGVVWPAMNQPRGHIGQQFAAHRFAVEPADSGYSAHMTSASIVPAVTLRPDEAGDPGPTSLLERAVGGADAEGVALVLRVGAAERVAAPICAGQSVP